MENMVGLGIIVKGTQVVYNVFVFNRLSAKSTGSKGGKARTKVKRQAARANGRLGGRPPSRTLAERLLKRSIHPEQQKYIDEALSDMLALERQQLEEYFQLKNGIAEAMNSSVWRTKSRRVPKQIRYLIKKFRLAANHYLRDVPAPKPYTVEYVQRSQAEQEARDHWHSGIPCPPRKVRIDVRDLPHFDFIELKHREGVTWTLEDMVKTGGGKWTKKCAEQAIKWLSATYPQSHS
jgi:ribosomal protein L31E